MKRLLLFVILLMTISAGHAQRGIYSLPEPYGDVVSVSGSITRTRAGRILTVNTLTDTMTLFDLNRTILAEFAIGENPTGVAVVPDFRRAVAVSESSMAILSLESYELIAGYEIEGLPYGIVADQTSAYISLKEANEVIVVNLDDGSITQRIPTPPAPAALAKWGDYLYVTHFWTGEFSLIYIPTAELVRTIQPNPGGTLFAGVEINPINGIAYLVMSIANNSDTATEGNRFVPMLYEVDLSLMNVRRSFNLSSADRNANMPYAVRQPSNRTRLYIAYAGSDSVTVLNLDTGEADNHFDTGTNPRGLVFSSDYTLVYTADNVDAGISVFDTRFFGLYDQMPASTIAIDPQEQIGTRLFNTALDTRLSSNGLMSCASCHHAGQSDGRIWLGSETPASDEYDDISPDWINEHIMSLQGGSGLRPESIDMDALIYYLENHH